MVFMRVNPKVPLLKPHAAITGDNFTVTLADATKYGNALIGIYESAELKPSLVIPHLASQR